MVMIYAVDITRLQQVIFYYILHYGEKFPNTSQVITRPFCNVGNEQIIFTSYHVFIILYKEIQSCSYRIPVLLLLFRKALDIL